MVDTTPQTQTFTLSFPDNKTNQTQTGTLPQFDSSLGTLNSIDLVVNGQITSDIKVENEDPSPATINGVVSGKLNLSGPDFNTQVTTSSTTKTFHASAWDGINDYAGTSGKDFGSATVPGSAVVTIPAKGLADYSGSGTVTIAEMAQATSSADGGGNLLAKIASSGAASVTIRYHYTPSQTAAISSDVFPPLPSTFSSPRNLPLLSKADFLAVGGSSTMDPMILADATYVDGLYRTLLNRPADTSGLISLIKFLRSGGTRTQAVSVLWNSDEHRALEVQNYYQNFLHRAAEPAAVAAWVSAFHAGVNELTLADSLLTSAEYQADHPNDAAYINAVYQNVLGGLADTSALSARQQALQNGVGRDTLVRGLLSSDEASIMYIDDNYINILHRGADLGGRQAFLNLIRAGQATPATVSQALLASDEFFHMAVVASQM
jgi:hypothetical protein